MSSLKGWAAIGKEPKFDSAAAELSCESDTCGEPAIDEISGALDHLSAVHAAASTIDEPEQPSGEGSIAADGLAASSSSSNGSTGAASSTASAAAAGSTATSASS